MKYIETFKSQWLEINELKNHQNFKKYSLKELRELPAPNGIYEFEFKNNRFLMLNVDRDDAIPLKYFWRDGYELMTLKLWNYLSMNNGICLDVGSHTGIFSIIGNLNKSNNNIISFEPFHLNFARLLTNLKLNNIIPNCFMYAVSDHDGVVKMNFNTSNGYHTSGGKVSDNGSINIRSVKIDSINVNQNITNIKIDTEGHEFQVLKGAENTINNHKPNIIFEINEGSFDRCVYFLNQFDYKYFFIDEENNKFVQVSKYMDSLGREEGSNCFATNKYSFEMLNLLII